MQLDLFRNFDESERDKILTEKANRLLDAVNDDNKIKYAPQWYFQHEDLIVLVAANKEKDVIFNIIDANGNIPNGFSACWRDVNHIRQELKLN